MSKKEIEKLIIEVCLRVAKRGEGALIVLGDLELENYKPLIQQTIPSFDIDQNIKLFESLCLIDGAVCISNSGRLYAYGVLVQSSQVLRDFGTRHSAGLSASLKGVKAFVVSEEDKKIRIFDRGKMIMQIDTLEKGIEKKSSEISDLLQSLWAGAFGFVSTSLLGIFSVAVIPGVLIFGIPYYLANKIAKVIQK